MLVATAQEVFTVAVQTPFNSINDVIAYAKANPGKLNYGSVGIGSSAHLATVLFNDIAGIQMQHVPYSQMSQGISDVLTGRTEVWFTTFSGPLPHIKSGKVRAFAVTGPKRAAQLARPADLQGTRHHDGRGVRAGTRSSRRRARRSRSSTRSTAICGRSWRCPT